MARKATEKADREAAEREALIARERQAAIDAYIAEQAQKQKEELKESNQKIKEAADKAEQERL